ncbi:MAG: radical SAM protein [Myxococcales bacterium]|nr:radical SAM protein [Myxococcales bacterium]MDH5305545.1 radical SAM protein [Myxococcales bacterium]MDH5565214.1 radical SAM protein [Myxococcales bacterium]
MIPVSDFLEIASEHTSDSDVRSRAPARFAGSSAAAPVVIWNVCMHCNMTCPHCYAAAVSSPSPTDLTTAEACDLLEQLAACGVRVVIFSGGEPLLRPDLFELLALASALGISPQLSSNGVCIDERRAERLAASGVAYVGISIDGIPSFNDDYRGLDGGHAAAVRGLRCAKAAGMRTGLRTTLTRRNADQIEAMIALAGDLAADRFYLSHLLYSGRGFHVADDDLARAAVRAILERVFEIAESLRKAQSELRIVTGSNDSDGVFLLRWIERRYGAGAAARVRALLLARGGNSAGEKILNIDSRGRVHPDQFWRSAVLGDLRQQKFAAILEHPLREQLRRRLDFIQGRCAECAERVLCRGSHRERALAHHRDAWASDPACVMEDAEIGVGTAPGERVASEVA